MKSEGLTPEQLAERNAQYVTEISRLEKERAALAAENAGLKAICDDCRRFIMNGVQMGYIKVPTAETDPDLETIRIAISPQKPIPATDAFLAEVRAQGLEMFAQKCNSKSEQSIASDIRDNWKLLGEHATDFAAELRNGGKQ